MKKDCTRDYATGAFARYALLGCPTRAIYEAEIRRDVYNRLAMQEPRVILLKANAAIAVRRPILDDIEAVERMFEALAENGKPYISDAVRAIYMYQLPENGALSRGEIKDRVVRYAQSVFTDERTVYRWLRSARLLFASLRGLTIEESCQ